MGKDVGLFKSPHKPQCSFKTTWCHICLQNYSNLTTHTHICIVFPHTPLHMEREEFQLQQLCFLWTGRDKFGGERKGLWGSDKEHEKGRGERGSERDKLEGRRKRRRGREEKLVLLSTSRCFCRVWQQLFHHLHTWFPLSAPSSSSSFFFYCSALPASSYLPSSSSCCFCPSPNFLSCPLSNPTWGVFADVHILNFFKVFMLVIFFIFSTAVKYPPPLSFPYHCLCYLNERVGLTVSRDDEIKRWMRPPVRIWLSQSLTHCVNAQNTPLNAHTRL